MSIFRVANEHRGRADINRKLDASTWYKWTMLGADLVGLVGVGMAIYELKALNTALRASNVGVARAAAGRMDRPTRRALTAGLELNGAVVGSRVINKAVRQKLLDGAGAALGVYSSYDGGTVKEVIVWVTEEK